MEQNASGIGERNGKQIPNIKKQKPVGIEWEYAINISGNFKEWECKLCHVTKSGGAPRLRDHFLGGFGKGNRKCNNPNAHLAAKRIRDEYQKKERNKFGSQRSPFVSQSSNASQTPSQTTSEIPYRSGSHTSSQGARQTPCQGASQTPSQGVPSCNPSPEEFLRSNVASASSNHFTDEGMRMRQTSLQESLRASQLEDAQMALAQAIFYSGSAMFMVESDHWKYAWRKIGEFGPGFTAPSYNAMRNDMLLKCYAHVKERVQGIFLDNLNLSGCTIVSDGWSNVQRKPLINIMIVSPRGETFVKAIDSVGSIKSGSYIADVIKDVMEEIGPQNVVQIVMDNAKNCKAAGRLLKRQYPHVYPCGCNTHSLNLLLKDWYKNDDTAWFAKPINIARKVVKFILKRQRVLDIYRDRCSVMLKLPAETRFCTYFYTLDSLLRNKDAVVATFTCMQFHEWESTQNDKVSSKVVHLRASLNKSAWWRNLMDVYHVMMPVMYAIRNLDQATPNLGKVWMTWWTVQRSLECPERLQDSVVQKEWRVPFTVSQRKLLLKYFHARWVGAHSPLHSAAYMLDPEYWNLDLMSNVEVVQDFYSVINTFYADPDERIKCIKEMSAFRLKEKQFSSSIVQQMAKEMPAWKWWMMNGGEHFTLLRNLAMKILSQCSSNSSSERNWSMYKYVHSTVRNRLLTDRADKLVYMYCNEKILRRFESEEYEEQVPRWMYECNDEENDMDVGPILCTMTEVECNLDIPFDDLQRGINKLNHASVIPNDPEEEEAQFE